MTGAASAATHAKVEIQGHRGARGHAPENTLAGFSKALAIGVDTLELDLGMSRDGVLMVHHDLGLNPDITRDRDGRWIETSTPLIQLEASAIAEFDVGRIRPGSRYQARFPHQHAVDGEGIPSLEQLLQWLARCGHDQVRLNMEVKSDPEQAALCAPPEDVARRLLSVIESWQLRERVLVQSFDWRIQRAISRLSPDILTAYLSSQQPGFDTVLADRPGPSAWTADVDVHGHGGCVARAVSAAGGSVWTPDHRDLDGGSLSIAEALGLQVVVWTVNETADIERALELGVHGIISDYPDRVRDALSARGMALPKRRDS